MPEGLEQQADIYIVAIGDVQLEALQIAERIRDELPYIRVVSHCGGGSLKSQMKKADKSTADIALILGEDEVRTGKLAVKYLRQDQLQVLLTHDDVIALFRILV